MIEAMKQALEALEDIVKWYGVRDKNDVMMPSFNQNPEIKESMDAITTLRQAIAEAEKQERFFCERCGKRLSDGIHTCTPPAEAEKQEPVGHADFEINNIYLFNDQEQRVIPEGRQPLYTHPPKREWVGLTDEDILDALRPHYEEWEAIELLDLSSEDYKLIEAKLRQKNT